MNELEEKLEKESKDNIKNYLLKYQELFQNNHKTNYKDFMFGIKQYDKLISILELDEEKDLLINEMIDRINYLDIITIFKTNIKDLYFSRIEQYGYADEDAVVYRLAFCNNINDLLNDCKEFSKKHDFIKERLNNT